MGTFKDLSKKMAALKAEMKKAGKEAIKEEFREFFEKFPEVESVRWQQWIPGFNDGDACTFTVGETVVSFKEEIEGIEPSHDDGFYESYDYDDDPKYEPLNEALSEIDEMLSENESLLQGMFGDNAEITVTPKKITVSEYDCGY